MEHLFTSGPETEVQGGPDNFEGLSRRRNELRNGGRDRGSVILTRVGTDCGGYSDNLIEKAYLLALYALMMELLRALNNLRLAIHELWKRNNPILWLYSCEDASFDEEAIFCSREIM